MRPTKRSRSVKQSPGAILHAKIASAINTAQNNEEQRDFASARTKYEAAGRLLLEAPSEDSQAAFLAAASSLIHMGLGNCVKNLQLPREDTAMQFFRRSISCMPQNTLAIPARVFRVETWACGLLTTVVESGDGYLVLCQNAGFEN